MRVRAIGHFLEGSTECHVLIWVCDGKTGLVFVKGQSSRLQSVKLLRTRDCHADKTAGGRLMCILFSHTCCLATVSVSAYM